MADGKDVPKLKREMSGFGGMIITLSGLSPTFGVFVAAPVIIQQSGSFVVLACLMAVLLGLVVSGVYAELGSAFPHAGGDYVLVGETLGPTLRFAALAIMMVGFPIATALAALAIADFLKVILPAVEPVPCALICIVVVTVLATLSVRMNAWVTGLFLAVEIVALIATALLGFIHPHRDLLHAMVHPVMASSRGDLQPTPLLAMGAASVAAVFVLNGYGGAVMLGEEVIGARRKMVWMIYGALLLAAVTIMPPLAGVVVGARDLARLGASPTPLQDFILEAGGPRIAALISLGVALAIFNAMIANALLGARIVYASARENSWLPGLNAALSKVHIRYGSPWVATVVMGAVSLFLCFAPQATLVLINGSSLSIDYGLLALGVIAGRRTGSTIKSQWRMPGGMAGPWIVVLAAIALLASALLQQGSSRAGAAVSVGILAVGALYYRLVVRRAGTWSHHVPDEEQALASA